MIKGVGSKFDDYSILPKVRQILLHLGYELTEKDFLSTQFQTTIYMTSEFNFCKKKKKKTLPAFIFAKNEVIFTQYTIE